MKYRQVIIAFALFVVAPLVGIAAAAIDAPSVLADAPQYQAWEYAAIQPSKLGTVEAVDASFRDAHAAYAAAHDGCWTGDCYFAAATEWLNSHGCSGCYVNAVAMSFKLKVDAPNYQPVTAIVPPGAPEPWMFYAVEPSGLLNVGAVQRSVFGAQVDYAAKHGGCWDHDCTEAVYTEWLQAHGCSGCFVRDNQLSFAVKVGAQKYAALKDAQLARVK